MTRKRQHWLLLLLENAKTNGRRESSDNDFPRIRYSAQGVGAVVGACTVPSCLFLKPNASRLLTNDV
jgi:hypothetical protein